MRHLLHPQPRPLALWLATLCAAGALAAETPPTPQAAVDAQLDRLRTNIETLVAQADFDRLVVLGDALDFAGGELGTERVVKGAPYCADAIHETVQWLPDGAGGAPNRIVRQQSTRLCRDGEGRTRQEVERGGRKLVYLRDPVGRESWVLDPERKTARRLGDMRTLGLDTTAIRENAERLRELARSAAERATRGLGMPSAAPASPAPPTPPRPPMPPLPPMPPMPVIISGPDDANGAGPGRHEVRVMRLNRDGESSEWVMPPAAVQWRAQNWAPRGSGSVTPLGGKEVEGVRANGERTSWTIEAGKVGNEKPILITREVWTAPDLMVTVSSRDFDPRNGEINYRLKNLKRGEPDAALMKVPSDFSKPARPSPRASGPTG